LPTCKIGYSVTFRINVEPTHVNTTSACEDKVVRRSESECDPTTASTPNALSLVALSVERTRARIEKVFDLGWLSRRVSTEPPMYPIRFKGSAGM
jgi:hypothetical protein